LLLQDCAGSITATLQLGQRCFHLGNLCAVSLAICLPVSRVLQLPALSLAQSVTSFETTLRFEDDEQHNT
jgi:hypothetical protein